jgi:hypothetical protein
MPYGTFSKTSAPHPTLPGCPSQPNFCSEDTMACAQSPSKFAQAMRLLSFVLEVLRSKVC